MRRAVETKSRSRRWRPRAGGLRLALLALPVGICAGACQAVPAYESDRAALLRDAMVESARTASGPRDGASAVAAVAAWRGSGGAGGGS